MAVSNVSMYSYCVYVGRAVWGDYISSVGLWGDVGCMYMLYRFADAYKESMPQDAACFYCLC